MIILNNAPCNGVDLSHWNEGDPPLMSATWMRFFGHKAVHIGGKGMTSEGVDPQLGIRRSRATMAGVWWRAYYMYLVPSSKASALQQVAALSQAIGNLQPGESVYLDWEDAGVSRTLVNDIVVLMNMEYPSRWFMYANDNAPEYISWMSVNKGTDRVPLMLPDYSATGFTAARDWNATIWQTGAATPPGFKGQVPVDYVLRPDKLDLVCGRV